MFKYFIITLFCGVFSNADTLQVMARQIGPTDQDREIFTQKLLQHSVVKKKLNHKSYRIVSSILQPRQNSSGFDYAYNVYNYTDNKMLSINGPTNFATDPKFATTFSEVPAAPDEFNEAVDVLKYQSNFSNRIIDGDIEVYEPMPSITADPKTLNGIGGSRLIGVGLRSKTDPKNHEIVGVNLNTSEVVHYPNNAPPTSLATEAVCGLSNAGQSTTGRGRSGSAEVEITSGSELLWKFVVVRPSSSFGSNGSGLELRNVYYKGKLVLKLVHTPILNVQYSGNACGPYRDWAYAENYFSAVGSDLAPGIRMTTQPPTTIFDTGTDYGNFRGVAIHKTDDKVTLLTEISAGWYRYASRIELYNDGTIKPLFQFSAVRNSCVCYTHHHHVYWRFDFDLNGTSNYVDVSNGSNYSVVSRETNFVKNSSNQFWRISDTTRSLNYVIKPGANDGVAGSYGIADAWVLRYKSNQIDDRSARTSTRNALNAYLTNESVENQDIVFWYAGHFLHSHDDITRDHEGQVGPTIYNEQSSSSEINR